jgi:SAM-dependent methyltransferase
MGNSTIWYEDDNFWQTWGPVMFNKQRIANTPTEVDQIQALIHISPQARILDLCCAVGRHSLELARRGFRVTAVDRTHSYLEQAREQAKKEGLEIEFLEEDMRNFFRPDGFDAIISLFTSFGYFEDQADDRKVATNIFRSLKSGGLFLIDLMSKEILAREFRERDWREVDGIFWLEERKVTDDWSRTQNRWIMFKDNQRFEGLVDTRLYSASELRELLHMAGFTDVQAYGGLEGIPYEYLAKRLVLVGHKH